MLDKFNKVPVQIIIAVITVCGSYGLLYLTAFKEVPQGNRDLFNAMIGVVIGSSTTSVFGWLYTQSKSNQQIQK